MLNSAKSSAARNAMIAGAIDTVVVLVAMLTASSSVILADFFKTLLEFFAVFLVWIAIRRIQRGGLDYEYGLGKLENLSSIGVASLMFIVCAIVVWHAVGSIVHPAAIAGIGLWIILATEIVYGFINAVLWIKAKNAAAREQSPIMDSQAKLFFARLFGNVFIFGSIFLSLSLSDIAMAVYIDPIASLIIAATIFYSAVKIFSTSVYDLLDHTLEERDQLVILQQLAKHFDRYEGLGPIRSRRSGNRSFVEISLKFDPNKQMGEVEQDISAIREDVQKQLQGSTVVISLHDNSD